MNTPALRFHALKRARIDELIAPAAEELSPLTLMRAPAGFGKTTAAVHWVERLVAESDGVGVRWVRSPGPGEDPRLIWHRICEALGGGDRRRDHSRVRDDVDRLLSGLTGLTVLVIDDYQHISSGDLDLALARLLERTDRLCLVVLSRGFTALDGPLVSSRVGVTSITGDELAFTEGESLELGRVYGIDDAEYIAQLHRRADGWPVMMRTMLQQFAAGATPRDSSRTLAIFGRQHLEGLEIPGAKRALLGAVLCPDISAEVLAELMGVSTAEAERTARDLCEQGLLQESHWEHTTRYRCHAGLAGPLHALALQEIGPGSRELRLRHAADLGRDDPAAAAIQLIDAEEYDDVSRLIARYFLEVVRPGSGVLPRLRRIPDEDLRRYPVLLGAVLMSTEPGRELSGERIAQLYQWLRTAIRSELREGNYEQNIAAIGLLLAAERTRGNGAEALRISSDAEARIERVPENRIAGYRFTFPLLFSALGLTGLVAGDLQLGERNYRRAVEVAARFENGFEELRGWNGLAAIAAAAGDLRAAEEHVRRATELRERRGVEPPQFSGFNVMLAEGLTALERGDAERALRMLDVDHDVLNRLEPWPLILIAEARARELRDGPHLAIEELDRRRTEVLGGVPSTPYLRCMLVAHAVRLNARIGNYAEAESLLESLPSSPHVDVAAAGAVLRLFRGDDEGALDLCSEVDALAPSYRQRAEVRLVAAAAHWRLGDAERAVSRFAEAGELLRERGLRLALAAIPFDVLGVVADATAEVGEIDLRAEVEALPAALRAETFDPLTRAELRTLSELATGAPVSEIAERLFITENTVKFHLKHIYRKLRAVSRGEAVERARAMRLVRDDE